MKARRADFHLQTAERQFRNWVNSNPYTIVEKEDPDALKHAFKIIPHPAPEDIALTVGDFVNSLRSALDQLAWNLVNLFPETVPTSEGVATQVAFPICRTDQTYRQRRAMFHASIQPTLDSLQPSDRANAIYTHHLWKLEKLWNIDKHRTIPVNCGNWTIKLQSGLTGEMGQKTDGLNYYFYVIVPCIARFCHRPRYVKPKIIPEILFGEYMGTFEVSIRQLREIHEFVTREVIPKFAGFFPSIPVS